VTHLYVLGWERPHAAMHSRTTTSDGCGRVVGVIATNHFGAALPASSRRLVHHDRDGMPNPRLILWPAAVNSPPIVRTNSFCQGMDSCFRHGAGGCGFIGSNFIRYLLETTWTFASSITTQSRTPGNLANLEEVRKNPRYRFVRGDITDRNTSAGSFRAGWAAS